MVEKIFLEKICFSLEWKSEGVMGDDSGDIEEDEGEEDWLRQGWRSETGSLFQRWGDALAASTFCDPVIPAVHAASHRPTNIFKSRKSPFVSTHR